MKIVIHEAAEEEAFRASCWHAEIDLSLRDQFDRDLETTLAAVQEKPRRHSCLEYYNGLREIRRKKFRSFKYLVIYTILADRILVLSISHTSREPLYWLDRLNDLTKH
jgi:plasmid stabilization system protein ParE